MDDENILDEELDEVDEVDEDIEEEVDDEVDEETDDDDDDELNSDTDDDEADDDEEGGDGEDEEVENDETPTNGGETDLKARIAELEKKLEATTKSATETANPSVQAIWQRDYDAVKAKYPGITATSVHDFGDRWREIMADKNNGLTAVEAFEVTHLDEVRKAAAQEAVAQKRSKDKFKGTGKGVAAHTIAVPPETYAMFKALNKGMTDKQIEKKYKKFHNL